MYVVAAAFVKPEGAWLKEAKCFHMAVGQSELLVPAGPVPLCHLQSSPFTGRRPMHTMSPFLFLSVWYIFMFNQHGIISPLMSKVRPPWAPRGRPAVSGVAVIAAGSVEVLSQIRHFGSGGDANLACDLSRFVVLLSCYTADSFLVSLFLLQRWGTWQTSSWCL